MRIYENEPLINIRPRFDFDSDKPVQGVVVNADQEQAKVYFYEKAVHNLAAVNVVLGGWFLMAWWFTGGFHVMTKVFVKGASYLFLLAQNGIFTG